MKDNQTSENKRKVNHPILLAISIILIIAVIAGLCVYEIGKQRQLRDLEAQALSLCERYGLENVTVKIQGPSDYKGYKLYDMHITGSGAADEKDPYNAKDYRDPEDFYEDYYDDFYDYEDAEDYYYDNCD